MSRENLLYSDERLLPYLVRLVRQQDGSSASTAGSQVPCLMHLDLRGGQFSRGSSTRLTRAFDWMVRGRLIRQADVHEYCLEIIALDPDQDFYNPEATPQQRRPQGWQQRFEGSFRWIPIPLDEDEEQYAWQR